MKLKTVYSLAIHTLLLGGLAHLGGVFDVTTPQASQTLSATAPAPFTKIGDLPLEGLPAGDLRLIQALNLYGVPVVLGSCQEGIYGLYEADQNLLVVCTNTQDPSGVSDTLRHEAVHAAQDCYAGQDNAKLRLLEPDRNPLVGDPESATDTLSSQIKRFYAPPVWALEWEAFTIAGEYTSEEAAAIVSIHCGPTS